MKCSKRLTAIVMLLFVSCFWVSVAEAVTAAPVVHTHKQSEGNEVWYRLHGDEFLTYMTDGGGNLVAFGEDGDLYIANWISERDFHGGSDSAAGVSGAAADSAGGKTRFVVPTDQKSAASAASAVGARKAPAESRANSPDIPKYLLEYAGQKRAERDRARGKLFGDAAQNRASLAPPADPGDGVKKREVLIIYVQFTDNTGLDALRVLTDEEIHSTVFGDTSDSSVARYYNSTVTGGNVQIVPAKETYHGNDGVIVVTLEGQHGNFGAKIEAEGGVKDKIIKPALAKATQYVEFQNFDKDDDSVITPDELSIGFMVHGYEASANPNKEPNIWAHADVGDDDLLSVSTPYTIRSYFAYGAFMYINGESIPMTAGTIAHELGHDAFRFIDVYDYDDYNENDGKAQGIGNWSLMGSGNWSYTGNGPIGSCPTPIDAYNLLYIVKPTYEKSDTVSQDFSLTNPWQIMKVKNSVKPLQYFLLQPRGNVGYDRGLLDGQDWGAIQSGLLIYHVDEDMDKKNRPNDWNDHPLVDIEEAHGEPQDLQEANENGGNDKKARPDDLFSKWTKRSFNGKTDPNSNLYDSDTKTSQDTPSGVSVSDIESGINAQEVVATFVVGNNGGDEDGDGGSGGCDTGTFALAGLFAIILVTKFSRGKIR
jgi:M6 family metalloprotease-like protein